MIHAQALSPTTKPNTHHSGSAYDKNETQANADEGRLIYSNTEWTAQLSSGQLRALRKRHATPKKNRTKRGPKGRKRDQQEERRRIYNNLTSKMIFTKSTPESGGGEEKKRLEAINGDSKRP